MGDHWFETEFGFREPKDFQQCRAQFDVEHDNTPSAVLVSKANGKRFHVGRFEAPSVRQLLERAKMDGSSSHGSTADTQCNATSGDLS